MIQAMKVTPFCEVWGEKTARPVQEAGMDARDSQATPGIDA
jgi:hypothetical protein